MTDDEQILDDAGLLVEHTVEYSTGDVGSFIVITDVDADVSICVHRRVLAALIRELERKLH